MKVLSQKRKRYRFFCLANAIILVLVSIIPVRLAIALVRVNSGAIHLGDSPPVMIKIYKAILDTRLQKLAGCMIDHDRLFKELLSTFFWEFIELFFPAVTIYLERDSITFLDKELFADVTSGERREVALVLKAQFSGFIGIPALSRSVASGWIGGILASGQFRGQNSIS